MTPKTSSPPELPDLDTGALKRAYRAARRDRRRAKRNARWVEVRCWWTWPIRHEFVETPDGIRCVGCNAQGR